METNIKVMTTMTTTDILRSLIDIKAWMNKVNASMQLNKHQEGIKKELEDIMLNKIDIIIETVMIIESLKGLSPQEFAKKFNIKFIDTLNQWDSLYNIRTSDAFIISSDEELALLEQSININDWKGEWGEVAKYNGMLLSTFNDYANIKKYRAVVEERFDKKFEYVTKELKENSILRQIKHAEDLDEVRTILLEFDELKEGYYEDDLFICDNSIFDDCWGYSHDGHNYSFGFKIYP